MKRKLLIVSVLLGASMFLAGVAQATNYVLGYSSVDEEEIRWGGSTTYSTQWNSAITTWNALSVINIAADTAATYEDLTVSDVTKSTVTWAGQYTNSVGSDTIKFNTYFMNGYSSSKKQNVTTHELGHALGLAHSLSGNIMYAYVATRTSLGTQDTTDYHYLWGY